LGIISLAISDPWSNEMKLPNVLFLGLWVVANAAFANTITDISKVEGFRKGTSTSTDVVAALGNPEHEDHLQDGRSTLFYKCAFPKMGSGGQLLRGHLMITFDASSHLAGIRIHPDDSK